MTERSLLEALFIQLHLRLKSVLPFPLITLPVQLLTLHIHFHLQERRRELWEVWKRSEVGFAAPGLLCKVNEIEYVFN